MREEAGVSPAEVARVLGDGWTAEQIEALEGGSSFGVIRPRDVGMVLAAIDQAGPSCRMLPLASPDS